MRDFLKNILSILLLISPVCFAEEESGSLRGKIVNTNGESVVDARVIIKELDRGTFTDRNGEFLIERILPGTFTVKITHLGYKNYLIYRVKVRSGEISDLGQIQLQDQVMELEGTVVTATRSERSLEDVSNSANVVSRLAIRERNPKTSAEALREETGIFVQKTNHGGGSAIIRGLSSNQILLMVDGIRLNNSTYRLGNHQYLTTVDYNMLDKIEVVRGPTSVLYGSDALGGTINLITRRPPVSRNNTLLQYNVGLSARHATADSEKSGRVEGALYNHKIAFMGGFSWKNFGDLRRGKNSDHPQLENSTNGLLQSPSGYEACDADAKLFYEPAPNQHLLFAYQYAKQMDVPRYDKYESGDNNLWLYSPQNRTLAYLQYANELEYRFLSNLRITASFSRQEEGRNTQKEPASEITRELDDVHTYGFNLQLNSNFKNHLLTYGLEVYWDHVNSERKFEEPATGTVTPGIRGRYPDGAEYRSFGMFLQDEWFLNTRVIVTPGLRYSYFNTEFTTPFDSGAAVNLGAVRQNFQALTGSLGLLCKLNPFLSLSANIAQAFRAPNLSDLAKLGESKGTIFEVPNTGLEPEKMFSADLGIRFYSERLHASVVGYYARIYDILASVDATYNNSPVIVRGQDTLKVKRKENVGNAYISGVETALHYRFYHSLSFYGNFAYTYGQNRTVNEPVGGIPPAFGTMGLRWDHGRYYADFFTRLAAKQNRLSADDQDDPRIPEGGTPAWQIYTFRSGIKLLDLLYFQFSVENVFDVNYREHGSGINSPGRNFVFEVQLRK
jgi:outer membrane receptor protein involved in Fe transport